MNIWNKLPKGFVGLAPMDGVTDYLYRHIMMKFGKPDLLMTEFTAVEGLARNAIKLLRDFRYDDNDRPILAQVFGIDPECFYKSAIIVCELGFDGIDINMGCPAKKVSARGSGASLIDNPKLASEIIKAVKSGVEDYKNGKGIEDLGLKQKMVTAIRDESKKHKRKNREKIPVSVKTRIGTTKNVVDEWISFLLEHDIAAISVHGRTLKQMYSGQADWEAIGKASELCRANNVKIVGNGDVDSLDDARDKIEKYKLNGVLIGRASFGNPWVFSGKTPTIQERIDLAIYHCKKFEEVYNSEVFYAMRKHLGWYIKGISGAKKVRQKLMLVNGSEEVVEILSELGEKKGLEFFNYQ